MSHEVNQHVVIYAPLELILVYVTNCTWQVLCFNFVSYYLKNYLFLTSRKVPGRSTPTPPPALVFQELFWLVLNRGAWHAAVQGVAKSRTEQQQSVRHRGVLYPPRRCSPCLSWPFSVRSGRILPLFINNVPVRKHTDYHSVYSIHYLKDKC